MYLKLPSYNSVGIKTFIFVNFAAFTDVLLLLLLFVCHTQGLSNLL